MSRKRLWVRNDGRIIPRPYADGHRNRPSGVWRVIAAVMIVLALLFLLACAIGWR